MSIMNSLSVFQQHLDISCSNICHLPSPRSHFRLPFISLSLCHCISATFYSISSLFRNLLSWPCINHWSFVSTFPHLPTSSPITSLIENQGDGPSIVSLPSFEGSPVSFHCLSRLPPNTQKCLKLLLWLGRWLRTVTIQSWDGMMRCAGFHSWIDT